MYGLEIAIDEIVGFARGAEEERRDEEHNEDHEKDLRDPGRSRCDTAESEDSSDDRKYEECKCPRQHSDMWLSDKVPEV